MGIYDRDYQRGGYYDDEPGFHLGGARTWTTNLVILMFAIYVVQLLTQPAQPLSPNDDGWFTNTFRLYADVFRRPWMSFELLTYGFLHSVGDLKHILFNMVALWFFGRAVEMHYGKREFLAFFLIAIIFAGLTWILGEYVAHRSLLPISMLGASGGIAAVVILFCLKFPHQQVQVWGVFPLAAWILGVLYVGQDMLGAMGARRAGGADVAFTAHLGGALFAFIYWRSGMRLQRLLPSGNVLKQLQPRPKLRVHDPDEVDDNARILDDILKKIQDHGQESLTRGERRFLQKASEEAQKKRR